MFCLLLFSDSFPRFRYFLLMHTQVRWRLAPTPLQVSGSLSLQFFPLFHRPQLLASLRFLNSDLWIFSSVRLLGSECLHLLPDLETDPRQEIDAVEGLITLVDLLSLRDHCPGLPVSHIWKLFFIYWVCFLIVLGGAICLISVLSPWPEQRIFIPPS